LNLKISNHSEGYPKTRHMRTILVSTFLLTDFKMLLADAVFSPLSNAFVQ